MAKTKSAKKEEKVVETNYCSMQLSIKCINKNGILPVSDFYMSADTRIYKNGRFNICKHCMKEYVYDRNGDVDVNKFKTILRIFDLPFFKREWESSVEGKNETIGSYMKNVYLNHKSLGWLDGDIIDSKQEDLLYNGSIDTDLIDRWGFGFSNTELSWLEKNYHEWCTHHEVEKLSVKRLVQMICIKELEIRKARENAQPTDKLEKSLRELMSDSNLTPKTMSAMNESDSSRIYGVWVKDIEQYRPAEYFKDKKLYEDFDGIKDYFERFILRPMRNLLANTRDFDKEFTIEKVEYEDEE